MPTVSMVTIPKTLGASAGGGRQAEAPSGGGFADLLKALTAGAATAGRGTSPGTPAVSGHPGNRKGGRRPGEKRPTDTTTLNVAAAWSAVPPQAPPAPADAGVRAGVRAGAPVPLPPDRAKGGSMPPAMAPVPMTAVRFAAGTGPQAPEVRESGPPKAGPSAQAIRNGDPSVVTPTVPALSHSPATGTPGPAAGGGGRPPADSVQRASQSQVLPAGTTAGQGFASTPSAPLTILTSAAAPHSVVPATGLTGQAAARADLPTAVMPSPTAPPPPPARSGGQGPAAGGDGRQPGTRSGQAHTASSTAMQSPTAVPASNPPPSIGQAPAVPSLPAAAHRSAGPADPATGPRPAITSLQVQVTPPGMGPVDVRVQVQGSQVTTAFQVAHPGAQSALWNHQDGLRQALGQHGLQLAGLQVGVQGQGGGSERWPGAGASAGSSGEKHAPTAPKAAASAPLTVRVALGRLNLVG